MIFLTEGVVSNRFAGGDNVCFLSWTIFLLLNVMWLTHFSSSVTMPWAKCCP